MPKPVVCPTCAQKVPYGTIHEDILEGYPRYGSAHPGQRTVGCACCGRTLHLECATFIAWHHLWFSNLRVRAFIQRSGLVGMEIALCSSCGEKLGEQIVETYRALRRFDEGARFLEEFGKMDEAFELLAEIKG